MNETEYGIGDFPEPITPPEGEAEIIAPDSPLDEGDALPSPEAEVSKEGDGEPNESRNAIEAECDALSEIGLITNRERYLALRKMGLTSREAYILTGKTTASEVSKSHLVSTVPSGASSPRGGMSGAEMEAARSLFEGLSDSEIQKLYKKVTR